MRMAGAHWLVLLTAEREAFGSPRSQLAAAKFYQELENFAALHLQQPTAPDRESAGAAS
jgi:hypothetical protein